MASTPSPYPPYGLNSYVDFGSVPAAKAASLSLHRTTELGAPEGA
jgi:hypothetical protein